MKMAATLSTFCPARPFFKRLVIWLIAVQAFIALLTMMIIYTFQRNAISGIGDLYAFQASDVDESATFSTEEENSNINLPETFNLRDDSISYFAEPVPGVKCFSRGTDLTKTAVLAHEKLAVGCSCLSGYFGDDCGIPESVWLSCGDECRRRLARRRVPRRLIHGINVNHELEFFEARLNEIGDVIDVLIVAESNLTAGGDHAELYLLPQLKNGFMLDYQSKIIHVFIDSFPPQGLVDGWFADTFIRDYMGKEGLKRITGVRDDDLFLLLDADEIPDKRVLLFLKLYDGYPEPISLILRWSVYGFYWKRRIPGSSSDEEDVTRIVALATMRMIREVYEGNVMSLRRNHIDKEPVASRYRNYANTNGSNVGEWSIGTVGQYAGHHCSWCFKPEGIRLKLLSAQKDDKPRWGDYPEKLDLNYISKLIRKGLWFDDSQPFFLVKSEEDPEYAPAFFLNNKQRFEYLLLPPKSDD